MCECYPLFLIPRNDNRIKEQLWGFLNLEIIKLQKWQRLFEQLTSISGLLCLSTFWLEKFSRHIAASSVCFTAFK